MAEIIGPYYFDRWPLCLVRSSGVVPEELPDTILAPEADETVQLEATGSAGTGNKEVWAPSVSPTLRTLFPPNPMKALWTRTIKANH